MEYTCPVNEKFFLKTILFLIAIGCSIYAVCYYVGVLDYAQILNFVLYSCIAFLGGVALCINKRMLFDTSFVFVCSTFLVMFFSGMFQNSMTQLLPSALRYFAYLAFANVSYLFVLQYGVDSFISLSKKFLVLFVLLSVFWAIVEILSGNIDYLNGAYRLAGSFKKHQLGAALFAYVLLILYEVFILKYRKTLFHIVVYFNLLALLIATQSRALLGIFFVTHFLYYFFRIKSVKKLFLLGIGVVLFVGLFYYVVIYTDWLPRYKTMFVGSEGIYDASTLERLEIVYDSIKALKGEQTIWGIGMGGFENFYSNITGRSDVAAHNNYLLFYIEGGWIALIFYLLFQLTLGLALIKDIRKGIVKLARPAFMLFFGITIMSFLLNNYYFYCSELLVWSFIGAYLAEKKKKKGIVFSSK